MLTVTQMADKIFRLLWQKVPFRVLKGPKLRHRHYGPGVQGLWCEGPLYSQTACSYVSLRALLSGFRL